MPVDIPVSFINDLQREAFYAPNRNQLLCGGFGSGKTYIYCFKILTLLTSFNNYRVVVGRQTFKALQQTTVKTFFKVCPPALYTGGLGRYSVQDGYLRLINGSEILFIHLDDVNEDYLRGLEINACLLDQAEEVSETIADILAVRCGRWEMARPNDALLAAKPDWPMKFICMKCKTSHELPPTAQAPCPTCGRILNNSGRYAVPTYYLNTCNPEGETHHLYRYYHPDSPERRPDNLYLEFPSTDNPALDPETLRVMLSKDPSWVKRFVYGQWGITEARIHTVLPDSILDVSADWVENLLKKATLVRFLDHGESSPTAMLWIAIWQRQYFVYREYYQPGRMVSYHRQAIADLSGDEKYAFTMADPQIFKTQSVRAGGYWCVHDEYVDDSLNAPALPMLPADNNELGNRNRINEMLAFDSWRKHPITGSSPAPKLYFINKIEGSNYGCQNILYEIRAQRRLKLGEINGKPMYSEERVDGVADHAYDCLRYFAGSHAASPGEIKKAAPENSFVGMRQRIQMLKQARIYDGYGMARPGA